MSKLSPLRITDNPGLPGYLQAEGLFPFIFPEGNAYMTDEDGFIWGAKGRTALITTGNTYFLDPRDILPQGFILHYPKSATIEDNGNGRLVITEVVADVSEGITIDPSKIDLDAWAKLAESQPPIQILPAVINEADSFTKEAFDNLTVKPAGSAGELEE